MKGYVFLSNSTKPTKEVYESRAKHSPSNVSRPCIEAALKLGYEVFLGINRKEPESIECDLPIKMFDSHTYRSLVSFTDNRIAMKNLARVIKNNNVEVIHCNTPIGGLIGRLCGKKCKVKHVIYTAHGFHFFKGAPLINNLLYKTAERIMAHWTDAIITMNQEDYENAKKFKLKNGGKVYKVHGVGISLSKYDNLVIDRISKRKELGLSNTDIVCISAGDLVPRKNYNIAIKSIYEAANPNLHYLICGEGPKKEKLELLVSRLGLSKQVHFLGYRNDVKELLAISDFFFFTSLQEGLSRSLMEAMALGLPVIASRIRGNVDLIEDGKGGFLCDPHSSSQFASAILKLLSNNELRSQMRETNLKKIKDYDISVVEKEIMEIYSNILNPRENLNS